MFLRFSWNWNGRTIIVGLIKYVYGAPFPSTILLKEFLIFIARSSKGMLADKPTVFTVGAILKQVYA